MICTKCSEDKPLTAFNKDKALKSGYKGSCKTCTNDHNRKTRLASGKKAGHRDPTYKTRYYRLTRYGVTQEMFDQMVADQNNLCAVCDAEMTPPHVDHDHTTGVVRGLLCRSCNWALGHFYDDPDRLDRAAAYLRNAKGPHLD
jgi:hypothetical protein